METTYRYTLESPSGYQFASLYHIRSVHDPVTGKRRDITGTVYVGNPKTKNAQEACVTVTIQYPDSIREFEEKYERKSLIDPTVASLILTKHYTTCAENQKLPSGEGTTEMIFSTLSLVKQLCSFIQRVDLNDASTRTCDNGTVITLPYFYLTNHHKTWYESKFNAGLKTPALQQEYETRKTEWLTAGLEPFEAFQVRYLSKTPRVIQTALAESYRESVTTDEFFKRLYDKHRVSMTCILLHDWIDEYMRVMGLEPFVKYHKWYICVENIPTYPFRNKANTLRVTRKKNTNTVKRRSLWRDD